MNKYLWSLKDLKNISSNKLKVMSTFACGGGSTMGYKLAGYDVIAANDIDPEMAWHYKKNLDPKYYFLCPIKNLIEKKLPDELYELDILDGSPPCTTFSISGKREETWGKEKYFREGNTKQVLSDLFFEYLDLAEKLKPKVVVAENVKGMLFGNAVGYVKLIINKLSQIGYRTQIFVVNAADCGVPQRRERIIFCAVRNELNVPKLILKPKCKWIGVEEAIKDCKPGETKFGKVAEKFWHRTKPGDPFSKAANGKYFNTKKLHPKKPANTLTSSDDKYHWKEPRTLNVNEWKRIGSFPDDYIFRSDSIGKYIIGMSVPPRMMKVIADAIKNQWLIVK